MNRNKYVTDQDKMLFISQHPKLTGGWSENVNLCSWAYPNALMLRVKYHHFNDKSSDLHFKESELCAMGDTYSTALDCLFHQVMNLHGDYKYDDFTTIDARIDTYKRMITRAEELLKEALNDRKDFEE